MKSDLFFKTAFLILAAYAVFMGLEVYKGKQRQPSVQVGRFVQFNNAILDTATGALYSAKVNDTSAATYDIRVEPILK